MILKSIHKVVKVLKGLKLYVSQFKKGLVSHHILKADIKTSMKWCILYCEMFCKANVKANITINIIQINYFSQKKKRLTIHKTGEQSSRHTGVVSGLTSIAHALENSHNGRINFTPHRTLTIKRPVSASITLLN